MEAAAAREHWQGIYSTRRDEELSWFAESAGMSLELLLAHPLERDAPIIDVGSGASRLVDALLERGHTELTVLDIADAAMERSRLRLGARADRVRWLTADITRWEPDRMYRAWHDRAVFHFLAEEEQRRAYRATVEKCVPPGGVVVMGTFDLDGPERCSGLAVQRYSPETLAAELGAAFRRTDVRREEHLTPAGAVQRFQFSRFIRE